MEGGLAEGCGAPGGGCGAEGGSSAARSEDAPSPLERCFTILAIKACRSHPVCRTGVSSASPNPALVTTAFRRPLCDEFHPMLSPHSPIWVTCALSPEFSVPPPPVLAPPSPAGRGSLNPLSEAGLGSGLSCSHPDSAPPRQPASGQEQGSCPCQSERSPLPGASRTPWSSAQPLSSLLCGAVLGDSVSPPIWGESRASGGFHAAANSVQDGGRQNGPKGDPKLISSRILHGGFVQPPGEQPGSELPPQSCRAPFSPLAPVLHPKITRPRGSLTGSRGVGKASAAGGVSRVDTSAVGTFALGALVPCSRPPWGWSRAGSTGGQPRALGWELSALLGSAFPV